MNNNVNQTEFDGVQIMRAVVGLHQTEAFARFMGRSKSSVEKWCLYPELPSSHWEKHFSEQRLREGDNGIPNPITQCDRMFEWMLENYPAMARVFAERYARKLTEWEAANTPEQSPTPSDLSDKLMSLFREEAEFHHALHTGSTAEVEKEFLDVVEQFRQFLQMKRAAAAPPPANVVKLGQR